MAFLRSARLQRIDRALSSVLDGLDDKYKDQLRALPDGHSWRDVDILAATRDHEACKAYDRADALCQHWSARVAEARDDAMDE